MSAIVPIAIRLPSRRNKFSNDNYYTDYCCRDSTRDYYFPHVIFYLKDIDATRNGILSQDSIMLRARYRVARPKPMQDLAGAQRRVYAGEWQSSRPVTSDAGI